MKVKLGTMVSTALLGVVLMTGCAGRTELFVEKTVTNTDGSTQHIKATGSKMPENILRIAGIFAVL